MGSILLIAGVLVLGVWLGARLRRALPEKHLCADTRDTVKLAVGLVATMSALLLGLLVSSAKGSYDATRAQVIQLAGRIAFLDRVLRAYGPETAAVRQGLHAAVEEAVRGLWPGKGGQPLSLTGGGLRGDDFYAHLHQLTPRDDAQRALKAQALSLSLDLGQMRTQLVAQSVSSISRPLLVMVVAWLFLIFLSFSVIAPRNRTALAALLVSALSVAGAICLILELDRPFTGMVQISSQPLEKVLQADTSPPPAP